MIGERILGHGWTHLRPIIARDYASKATFLDECSGGRRPEPTNRKKNRRWRVRLAPLCFAPAAQSTKANESSRQQAKRSRLGNRDGRRPTGIAAG